MSPEINYEETQTGKDRPKDIQCVKKGDLFERVPDSKCQHTRNMSTKILFTW